MVEVPDRLREIREKLERQRQGLSLNAYARSIMIAPATLKKLLDDPPESVLELGVVKSGGHAKGAAGHAESIGRLYGFLVNRGEKLDFDVQGAARAFGLDTDNVHVQQGLLRARPADAFITQNDPTLVRIVRGDSNRPANQVRAGILAWPPYSSDRRNLEASFAGSMMTRLLGALNPLSWGPPKLESLEFHQVLTPDLLKTGFVDAIFSLYDVASRRIAGFDFIHVPGLSAPLGGLFFGSKSSDLSKGETRWADLLDPTHFSDLRVYVVGADAGELLMRGPCAYDAERVEAIGAEDVADGGLDDKIARTLIQAGRSFAEEEVIFREGGGFARPAPFAFVADAGMVERVRARYRALAQAEAADLPKAQVLDADGHRPAYPIGIAVSANSERWVAILRNALVRELFVNSGALTAKNYAALLAQPSAIAVGDLGDEIPAHVQLTFTDTVLSELKKFETSPDEAVRRRVMEVQADIQETWMPNAETIAFRDTAERLLKALSSGMDKLLADNRAQADKGDEA
jgi:hypothetical protein